MAEIFKPADAAGVLDVVQWAVSEESPLEIICGGTKHALGHPCEATHRLDLSGLRGVTLYEPAELVMTALPGTPLVEIEAQLAENHQQLAFEPPDLGPLLGVTADGGTIGGIFACNLSGPRRIKAGAARDHLLGLKAVTGRGEAIAAGSRVVKNVTGYDICKLMAGSYGTLAAMTELTFKVMPAPQMTRTVLVFGLDCAAANRAMIAAVTSPEDISGAAYLPPEIAKRIAVDYVAEPGTSVTALRIEGPAPSVKHRCRVIRDLTEAYGDVEELHGHNSGILWRAVGDAAPFVGLPGRAIWRISIPPSSGAAVTTSITSQVGGDYFLDWGGGLIWLSLDEPHESCVRTAIAEVGGHATLIVADEDQRRRVPVFEPQTTGLAALSARVKDSFDPKRILNPGRIYKDC